VVDLTKLPSLEDCICCQPELPPASTGGERRERVREVGDGEQWTESFGAGKIASPFLELIAPTYTHEHLLCIKERSGGAIPMPSAMPGSTSRVRHPTLHRGAPARPSSAF
jgi:hypothetical protein